MFNTSVDILIIPSLGTFQRNSERIVGDRLVHLNEPRDGLINSIYFIFTLALLAFFCNDYWSANNFIQSRSIVTNGLHAITFPVKAQFLLVGTTLDLNCSERVVTAILQVGNAGNVLFHQIVAVFMFFSPTVQILLRVTDFLIHLQFISVYQPQSFLSNRGDFWCG